MDATEAELWNRIKLLPVKSCELDPLPTWLLKECKTELVPLITDIVNMSLRDSMLCGVGLEWHHCIYPGMS